MPLNLTDKEIQDLISDIDQAGTGLVGLSTWLQSKFRPGGEHTLQVPYLSQWGTGADVRRGDCGPADVAMQTHFLTSHRPTVDQAAAACGQPSAGEGSRYTGHAQLRQGAAHYGFRLQTRSPYTEEYHDIPKLTLDLLRDQVNRGYPSIALIHYGVLRDRTNSLSDYIQNQDQNFGRGHWILFVGYDSDDVICHDSDFWGSRASDGEFRRIPADAFEAALATVAPGCTVGFQGLIVV